MCCTCRASFPDISNYKSRKLRSLSVATTACSFVTMAPPTVTAPAGSKARGSRKRDATDDHAKRKRELDRIAQRNSRERTKNRISFLEDKLRSLEGRDRDCSLSSLLATQETLLKENSSLKAAMMKVRFIADSILKMPDNNGHGCPNCNGQSGGSDNGESFETAVEQNQQQPAFNATSINAVEPPSEISAALEFDPFRNVQLDDLQSIPAIQFFDAAPPDPIAGESESFNHNSLVLGDGNDQAELFLGTELYSTPGTQNLNPFSLFCPISPSVSPVRSTTSSIVPHELKWHFTNGTFMQGLEMTRANQRARLAPLESRVPIQGILFGWHTVDPSTRDNPAWIALKEIDEKVFGTWKRKPQKIALMFVCSLIMAYRADPTPENLTKIPAWFRPRPLQERFQHPLVIDFLIWPGLREFLVFNHKEYTRTGEFSQHFVDNFHFNWPLAEELIYEYDPCSGFLGVSEVFKEYVFDLNNWTMEKGFFDRYQELASEIPCWPTNEIQAEHSIFEIEQNPSIILA
ncbi:hypothetical protein B0O99DRAFT_746747 [Bisporella sp. PMI_857]|nr:hypothetical protein B0O99DRAFT_746747 [Bisporella sp. PMI_857]